jgi:hypothetical protein
MAPTPRISTARPASRSIDKIADIVFAAPIGSVIAVGGTTDDRVRRALENADCRQDDRLALFVPLRLATSTEQIVDQAADVLAEVALRMWPVWFTDADFGGYRDDTLGREAARVLVRAVANDTAGVLRPWADAAVMSALGGRSPRVKGIAAAVEVEQLCLAINRAGLILIFDMQAGGDARIDGGERRHRRGHRAAEQGRILFLDRGYRPANQDSHAALPHLASRKPAHRRGSGCKGARWPRRCLAQQQAVGLTSPPRRLDPLRSGQL